MDGEKSLLKMLNPSKDGDSDFSINQIEDQVKCNHLCCCHWCVFP